MIFLLGLLTGLAIALSLAVVTRTRTYRRFVRWIWLADVRRTDPHLYGRTLTARRRTERGSAHV